MVLKYFNRVRRHIRDFNDYLRAFRRKEHINLHVTKVDNAAYLLAAKKLHAEVYLYRKFVSKKDVRNGILTLRADPHQQHSQYFVVTNKKKSRVIATARQINAKKSKGHESFALLGYTRLYDRARQEMLKFSPSDCVEISGLAKHRGVSKLAPLLLYREMWRYSVEHEHKLWLLACDAKLYVRLKLLFGPAIQRAGPKIYYSGGDVVPALLKIETSIRSIHKSLLRANFFEKILRVRVAKFILRGAPVEKLSKKERQALEAIMRMH